MLGQLSKVPTLHSVIFANFVLQFFYAWMVVYTPIYLHQHLGIPWSTIGVIFSIMLTAFVILDYPLGRLADKIGSEKELTGIGFCIMAITVFGFAFISNMTIPLIGILLFFSRVGAATVETMTEIHFFKIVDGENPMFLSIFRDLRPLAYVVTPVIATLSMIFLSFKSSFAVLGIVLIFGFFATFKMEKKSGWMQRSHRS
jgi:MFS family permease